MVRTWRHTPRFCGAPGMGTWRWRRLFQFLRMAGALILVCLGLRPLRTSWLMVGTDRRLLECGYGWDDDAHVQRTRSPGGSSFGWPRRDPGVGRCALRWGGLPPGGRRGPSATSQPRPRSLAAGSPTVNDPSDRGM